MKEYIGEMMVRAEPMSRGDYCRLRGWKIPEDEDATDEGLYMIREDGSVSWMLKKMFENTYRELKELEELEIGSPIFRFTRVYKEKEYSGTAPHNYFVTTVGEEGRGLGFIHFQEGLVMENGVNGVCDENLICMVTDRLAHFQESKLACRENEKALEKLEEALFWLRKRTMARRGEI